MNLKKRLIEALNEQAAQEYLRLERRLRSEPEWPFPLTQDDRVFVAAVSCGNWDLAKVKREDA